MNPVRIRSVSKIRCSASSQMSFHIELKPIYYSCIENADWLPGKQPYFHQQKIYDLIMESRQNNEFICIFNTAVTGGGKTLASYAASLLHKIPAFGLYPTNELIEDQERALRPEFPEKQAHPLFRIDSRRLDEWEALLERRSHQDTLRTLLNWRKVILTNPDIFYMLFFGLYQGFPGIAETLFNVTAAYPILIFDEFHLYNIKQIGNVAFMVATLKELQKSQGKVFIFSSATPNPRFLDVLERIGIRTEMVETQQAETITEHTPCVSQPLSLTLIPGDLTSWKGLEALEENFSLVEEFMRDFPDAKAVFIFDAVSNTPRLAHTLKTKYPHLSIGEIHGLASEETRKNALKSRLTVGTSTIEVGIDFKDETEKDLLVFEARTSSQFIQRLGRIARHVKKTTIPNQAIAIVPPYVYHELTAQLKGNVVSIERKIFYEHVENAYRNPNEFEGYLKRYSPVEAYAGVEFIENQQLPDTKPIVKEQLERTLEVLYQKPIKKIAGQFRDLCRRNVLKPLQSFRGAGFQVALIDKQEQGFPLKIYDLFLILRKTHFKELSPEQFQEYMESLDDCYNEQIKIFTKRMKRVTSNVQDLLGVYGYFEIDGFLDNARKVWFEIDDDELEPSEFNTEDVTTIQGLSIQTDPLTNVRRLNKLLARKELVCWASERGASGIRFSKALPALFQLYELKPIRSTGLSSKRSWSITFHQNSYFMNCLWFKKQASMKSYIL